MPKKRSSLVVRKPDGSYRCDFWARFPDGRRDRIRVVAPGKTENSANAWAERHKLELERHGKAENRAPAQTLAAFYPRFVTGHIQANGLKPSQIEAHRSIWETHLRDRFGRLPLDAIGPEQIQGLKSAMADRAPKTLNNVLTVLKTILRRANEWGEIKALPKIEPVRVPKRAPEFYDFAEFDRLVVAAAACGPMVLAMVLLGARAGLRDGEARALRWSDVDMSRRVLSVRRTLWQDTEGATKGAEERQVPIASELLAALEALPRHKKGDRVLFTTRSVTASHMGVVKWLERPRRAPD